VTLDTGTCATVGAGVCTFAGTTADILISVIGVSSSARHTPEETSAIRPKAAGISLITVASTSLPFEGLTILTLELSGRLEWAIESPSSRNSWVTFPDWVKPLV
jgi:hypothetical protein